MHSESKWFTHSGHFNTDPTKVKKDGAGAYNWGFAGDETDMDGVVMAGQSMRRNSNHMMNMVRMDELDTMCDEALKM